MNSSAATALRTLLAILRWLIRPRVFLPLIVVIYVVASFVYLKRAVDSPKGRADLVSGDARHYLQIAETFAAGDWSMSYVKKRPHRQPLYPALISPVIGAVGRDLFWLATVNVAVATVALALLYLAVLRFSHSPVIAAVISTLYAINPFVMVQTTRHFLTEPLHFLLMIVIVFALLRHLQTGRAGPLIAAAAATGLDYLTRPNGLFIMASMLGALVLGDVMKWATAREWPELAWVVRRAGWLAAALAVFIAITTPSWLPRLQAYGKPLHHGYLSNYLWVDTYEQAHVGQEHAIYTWRDYVASHTAWDAVVRMASGVWMVGFSIPFRAEKPVSYLFWLALGGVAFAIFRGPLSARVFVIFAVVQLLPLMWTNLSNPTDRVPYGAIFPLELALATLCLVALRDLDWQKAQRRIFT